MHHKDPVRQARSRRYCHLPAEEQPLHPPPRDTGAYVPEMAARIDDDRNLTDGARRCARKIVQYTYQRNRASRAAEITVTWLMRALGKSRRQVQRYLRQLERAGYIGVEVIRAGTRMCVGLALQLLAPLFPKHHRQKWPEKLIDSGAPSPSRNYRFSYKTQRISRAAWAVTCCNAIWEASQRRKPPLPPFPMTA